MASKKKYYDVETEFADVNETSAEAGFTFLDWLRFTDADALEVARRKESQLRVIDSFIRNAPKIKPVGKGDELLPDAPEEVRETETLNHEDIVSETLAQIYEEQGFFARAAEVYRKLGLINPEKKIYFAARLKELRKKESELKKQ